MITIAGRQAGAPGGATLRSIGRDERDTVARLRASSGGTGALPAGVDTALHEPMLGRVWLVEVDGVPAAYVAVAWGLDGPGAPRVARLQEVAVAPAYRGRGIGAWALGIAATACHARRIRLLQLDVERMLLAS